MKLSGSNMKAAIVGVAIGVSGTSVVMASGGFLGRGALPDTVAVAADSGQSESTGHGARGAQDVQVVHSGHDAGADAGHQEDGASAPSTAGANPAKGDAESTWACPMNDPATGKPEYQSDRPGRCPKCGMKLERARGVPANAPASNPAKRDAVSMWVCPMNDPATGKPEYQSDRPGRCPKCGMKLERAKAGPAGAVGKNSAAPAQGTGGGVTRRDVAANGKTGNSGGEEAMTGNPGAAGGQTGNPASATERAGTPGNGHAGQHMAPAPQPSVSAPTGQKVKWVCPMGHIVTDRPGDCPVCGMKLIKQTVGQAPDGAPAVPGTVMLSAEKQQQIGVRTAEAVLTSLTSEIRAAGKIELDESRISHVHTKIDGWIEDLRVRTTGESVRKGQPLLAIYSPDLVAAQQEYLQALATDAALGSGGVLPRGGGLAAAARERLRNWDFREVDLEELRRTRVPRRSVTLAAHSGGIVLEKKAVHGMRVMPGDELFTIADLSAVWVVAQVYESELPYVKVGATARVQLEALPGRSFQGKVAFVYPTLDPMTRTARVRIVLANPGMVLKPEMYATVTLAAPAQRELAIPAEAVLDSGVRQVAFVARPGGYFEPRVLKLGGYRGDKAIVKAGLKPGERVVTSANFLIDSESQLQAALSQMGGTGGVAHKH